jgi:hypothetical protein
MLKRYLVQGLRVILTELDGTEYLYYFLNIIVQVFLKNILYGMLGLISKSPPWSHKTFIIVRNNAIRVLGYNFQATSALE